MSNVFAKLFEEGERQQQQLHQPVEAENRTDEATVRQEQPNDRTDERMTQPNERTLPPTEHPNDRSDSATERTIEERPTRRYSYDFYADQVEAIRRLRAKRELAGEKTGLSEIVREALDRYLAEEDLE